MNEQLDNAFSEIFNTEQPLFDSQKTIGRCDACGVTDHHLRQGLCPSCENKYTLQGDDQ